MLSAFFRFHAACSVACLVALLSGGVGQPARAQSVGAQGDGLFRQVVPFVTLRNRVGMDAAGPVYGDERSGLSAGTCEVRALDLRGLASVVEQVPNFVREDLLRVEQVVETEPDAVLDRLQETAADRGVTIYVHGYYIGFEKGCRRAALLQDNAAQTGRFLWFSWPSDGALAYYMHDEADLYWSIPDLADVIMELTERFGDGAVNVVGHSLGARGVVLALYELANRDPGLRLGQVALLAPDMDFGIFQRFVPRIAPVAHSLTVYVTDNDRPLELSAQLHGYPRLGQSGNDVSTLAGVEVIDLSELPLSSPTGHLYHIHSAHVGADLDQLLNRGLRAAERSGLTRIGGNLWSMQHADSEGED